MTTMIAELYDALRDAGAAEDKARRAAEAMADYDNRFDAFDSRMESLERRIDGVENSLSRRIDAVEGSLSRRIDGVEASLTRRMDQHRAELKEEIGEVKSDVKLLKWMLGAVFAILIPMFLKTFLH